MRRKKMYTTEELDKFYLSFKQGDIFIRYKKYSGDGCQTYKIVKKIKTTNIANWSESTDVTTSYKIYIRSTDRLQYRSRKASLHILKTEFKRGTQATKILFGR